MSDDTTDAEGGHADHDAIERQTAPQGEYTMSDVFTGFGIALAGMALVFLVPFLLV